MNTVMEIEVTEGREGEEGRISIGKKHCLKSNLQRIEVIMNDLIPLEFHGASNDEPQALKLV
ncbi:hypothetical protein I79_013376 [Cricetulus griseus]|uniref:Uncharacterized protein n=1 Tax=Cricetulus griseus TaxID=10029 RepID=G3HRB1_CRIGR|nr:hypothetical protein I79_013376 [Cricetulus griseus]